MYTDTRLVRDKASLRTGSLRPVHKPCSLLPRPVRPLPSLPDSPTEDPTSRGLVVGVTPAVGLLSSSLPYSVSG